MEEKLNEIMQQMNVLTEKVSKLETNSISKDVLIEEIKPLSNEISAMKNEMISKNDIKIKLRTITGKYIDIYVKKQIRLMNLKQK